MKRISISKNDASSLSIYRKIYQSGCLLTLFKARRR
jgi:pyruvate ferredoxin oxidoreductase gamma subunit